MKLWILGSGSSGNAVLVQTERSRILIDAGFAPRVLKQRLAVAGVAPESIDAVVVTHEHTDHIGGVASILVGSHKRGQSPDMARKDEALD